jgi:hypothetical protein
MTKIWPIPVIAILNQGFSLEEIGIENWAFKKSDALIAINKLARIGVPVIKGDILELMDGSIEKNYDGWECEFQSGEPIIDFIKRSMYQAIDYIEDYPTDANILFVLTPAV